MTAPLPDAGQNWVDRHAPEGLKPWLKLGRFDRPIGIWLLLLPGWQGIMLAVASLETDAPPLVLAWLVVAFAVGACLMRAAGCAFNDIVDRDIDAKVARTAARPVASGHISVKGAWAFVIGCCLISLLILLTLNVLAVMLGVASLALVAAYPFMKRITWWPQAWLGLVFTWGLLVGWTQLRADNWDALAAMYLGAALWVIGYDTIYALQDREDDALVGIRSSALRMGGFVKGGVALCYGGAVALWALAFWLYRADWIALLALIPAAGHLLWQVATLDESDPDNPLARFRANRWAGALVAAACFVVGNAGSPLA